MSTTIEQPKPARERAAEQFAKDTDGFVLTVLHEDGDYRHLRFQRPGERWGSTDIHTWPGGLTTAGDMADGWMFERPLGFFAGAVNLSYWRENLTPAGRRASKEFSITALRESVAEAAADFDVPAQFADALAEDIKTLITSIEWGHPDTNAALAELDDFVFECEDEDGLDADYKFTDAYEMNVEDFGYHFVWATHVLSTAATWIENDDERVIRPSKGVNVPG